MLNARKKESVKNKKVKVINSTLLGGTSSIGLQVPQNLKDCVDLRNGADKELVKELDNAALDRMSTYMELNKQSDTTQDYVTRGAKISCSCGEYYILLDVVEDHGVIAANGKPLLTCRDCRGNINIHSFGKCFAEVKGYGKLPQPLSNRILSVGDKWIYRCIPNPTGRWMQKESVLQIGDGEGEEYSEVLISGAYLPCRHGGIIEVVEVPEGTDDEQSEKILPLESKWLKEHTEDMDYIECVSMKFLKKLGWFEIADYFIDKNTGERSDWKRAYNGEKNIFEFNPDPELAVHRRPINEQDVENLNRVLMLYKINKSKELVCAFMSQINLECESGAKMCEQVGIDDIQPKNTTRTEMKVTHEELRKYPYKFRGGGTIQITNVDAYKEVYKTVAGLSDNSDDAILDELAEKEYVGEEEYAIEEEKILTIGTEYVAYNYPWLSAGIFWEWKDINKKFEEEKMDGVIDAINRKTTERQGRKDAYDECMKQYKKYAEKIPWETENE